MRRSPLLLLDIICTILLLFGLVWYTRVGSVPRTTVTPIPSQEPSKVQSWGERFRNPELPSLPNTSWKTYTDTEHGFAFQYPAEWEIPHSIGLCGRPIVLRCGEPLTPRFPVATQPFDDVFSPDRRLNKFNSINSLRIYH
jgi:hypothetical protein